MYYNENNEPCGLITNIQGYTIHDGPGIRTEIFFKGCTLNCPWCSNPEGIGIGVQLGVYPAKCISLQKCGFCMNDCPMLGTPIRFDEKGILSAIDFSDDCRGCLKCADSCPASAIKIWGEKKTVAELLKVIESDRSFYERTGGGVTLSGGEVMVQWEFARLLLKECKKAGIHTCVESALFVPEEHVDAVLEYTDLLITDIKYIDPERHKEVIGSPNGLILANIKRIAKTDVPMIIRTPVVPGWNDDDENMLGIGSFIKELGDAVITYQLLPYRKMGTEKYATLNQGYPMGDYEAPEREVWEPNLLRICGMLKERFDIPVVAGSSGKLPPQAFARRK